MTHDPSLSTPIGFRALAKGDLPLIHRWLHEPHVARWWYEAEPITPAWVEAKYAPLITGREPTRGFIILHGATPIGFIQTYRLRAYPDYCRLVDVAEEAAGVDLFIGEPAYVHRGLGAPLLVRFLREVVFADPAIESCLIGPEPQNTAAIRAYEKAGFVYLKTIQVSDEPELEYLMRLARLD